VLPPNLEELLLQDCPFEQDVKPTYPAKIQILNTSTLPVSVSDLPPSLKVLTIFNGLSLENFNKLPNTLLELTVGAGGQRNHLMDLLCFAISRAEHLRINNNYVKAKYGEVKFYSFTKRYGTIIGKAKIESFLQQTTKNELEETIEREGKERQREYERNRELERRRNHP